MGANLDRIHSFLNEEDASSTTLAKPNLDRIHAFLNDDTDLTDLGVKLPDLAPGKRLAEFRALPDEPSLTDRITRLLQPSTAVVPGGSAEAIAQFESGRQPGSGKRDLEEIGAKPNLMERGLEDFASGAISTGAGLLGMASRLGSKSAGQWKGALDVTTESLMPADPTFLDELSSGFGSTATFFIPGMGIAKGAKSVASIAPRMALWLGAGAAAGMEAAVESGMVYDDLRQRGYSHDVASSRADKTFWANAGLLAVTNRFGLFGDYGGKLVKVTLSAVMEGGQEGAQQVISNLAEGREDIMEGVGKSALIGGIVGGGTSLALPGGYTTGPEGEVRDAAGKVVPRETILGDITPGVPAAAPVVKPLELVPVDQDPVVLQAMDRIFSATSVKEIIQAASDAIETASTVPEEVASNLPPLQFDTTGASTTQTTTVPNSYNGEHSDGEKWSATYETIQLNDGTFALIRHFTDIDGARTEHMTVEGMWAKGLPSKVTVSGGLGTNIVQKKGKEAYPSITYALLAAKNDAEGMGGIASTATTTTNISAAATSPAPPAETPKTAFAIALEVARRKQVEKAQKAAQVAPQAIIPTQPSQTPAQEPIPATVATQAQETIETPVIPQPKPKQRPQKAEILPLASGQDEVLRGFSYEAGWAEKGGHLIRERLIEDAGPATGPVIGRTQWSPKAPWWPAFVRDKSVRMGPEELRAAVEKAATGQPLRAKEVRAIRWLLDESTRQVEPEQYAEESYTEDPSWLTESQTPIALEPGEERETLDLMHKGLQMGLDADILEAIVERAAIQELSNDDILQQFENAVAQKRDQEGAAVVPPATETRVPAETAPEVDLFGQDTRSAQALADRQSEIDRKLGKDREAVPAESAGDLFDSGRAKQIDITEVPARISPAKLTEKIQSEQGYVYHATNADRLDEIATTGELTPHRPDYGTDQLAWPDGSTKKRSYFSRKADIVWQFAPEDGKPVVIRTKDGTHLQTESTGDVFSGKPIPSSDLEYLGEDGAWHPLATTQQVLPRPTQEPDINAWRKDRSPEYLQAYDAFTQVSREHDAVTAKFRNKEVGSKEFLLSKGRLNKAMQAMDEAEQAEKNAPVQSKQVVPDGQRRAKWRSLGRDVSIALPYNASRFKPQPKDFIEAAGNLGITPADAATAWRIYDDNQGDIAIPKRRSPRPLITEAQREASIAAALSTAATQKKPWQLTKGEWINAARNSFVHQKGKRRLFLSWDNEMHQIKDQSNGKLTKPVDEVLTDIHRALVQQHIEQRRRDTVDAESAPYPGLRDMAKGRLERPTEFYPTDEVLADYPELKKPEPPTAALVAESTQAPAEKPERYAVGKSLTKDQRNKVLSTLVDVYQLKGAPTESKGFDQEGAEIFGYVYSPDLFEKSSITGAGLRYIVTLPDGRIAHPSELFPDYTQSDIDRVMAERKYAEQQAKLGREDRIRILNNRKAGDMNTANSIFWKQNAAVVDKIKPEDTSLLTDGKQYIRVLKQTADKDLTILGGEWAINAPVTPEPGESSVAPTQDGGLLGGLTLSEGLRAVELNKIVDSGEQLTPDETEELRLLKEKYNSKPEPSPDPMTAAATKMSEAADKLTAAAEKLSNVQAAKETAEAKPSTPITKHLDVMSRLSNRQVTIDEFKQSFSDLISADRATIIEQLSDYKKAELLEMGGWGFTNRYKSEKKDRIADSLYVNFIEDYVIDGNGISFMLGSGDYTQKVIQAVSTKVDAYTQQDLDDYAAKYAKGKEERQAAMEEAKAGMENPQTTEDYRRIINALAKEKDIKTFAEARKLLPLEQRIHFDELVAQETREKRTANQSDKKTGIRTSAQKVSGGIIETKHTKKGHDLFVVQLSDRVSREDYNALNTSAKRMGGYYSSFRGGDAIPGFQFTERPQAEAFQKLVAGDTTEAEKIADERRSAFDDNRAQTSVERLRSMADALDEKADNSLLASRQTNTARRAAMASRAESSANQDKAMAQTMRNIADGIESGNLKYLDQVRQKTQVEMLNSIIGSAHYDELRETYKDYSEYEKNKDRPPTNNTVEYAKFPSYTAWRGDLAKLGRQLVEMDGYKQLGTKLLKLADDVSREYETFAKDNLQKVSTFAKQDGGAAIFTTQDKAMEAIARSGFRGTAIPLQIKRGQYMIVLSPAESTKKGIWPGAEDKQITLPTDLGEQLLEKASRANRQRVKVDIPWQLESAHEKRTRLKGMNIETPAEFRSALREYVSIRNAPKEPDRIKAMERAMVGRSKDGMDFFPTPESIANEMVDTADIKEGMAVLEPSAGMGHIADAIRGQGIEPDVIELSSSRRELLEAKGYNVVGNNFLEFTGQYDRILMNPPFSDRRDAAHIRHAYFLLKPGGRLVTIAGEGVFFGSDKNAQEFRDWLESVGATDEKLAEGAFMDKDLPVNTGVNARMIVIEKPDQGVAMFSLDLSRLDDKATLFTKAQAEAAIAQARKGVSDTLGLQINVIESAGIPTEVKAQIPAGKIPKGFVYQGQVYLVADAMNNARDAQVQFAHEVIGHVGMEAIMGTERWQALLQRFTGLKKIGGKEFQSLLEEVHSRYADRKGNIDPVKEMKEFIALAEESREQAGAVATFLRQVREFLAKALRALGFKQPFSMTQIHELLSSSEQYLKQGERQAQPEMAPAFSQGNIRDTQRAEQAAFDAANKELRRGSEFDVEEEIRSIETSGSIDLSDLAENPEFWNAEDEDFTDAGRDEAIRRTREMAEQRVGYAPVTSLDELNGKNQSVQAEAFHAYADGLGLNSKKSFSAGGSRYVEISFSDGKTVKYRFANHYNTVRDTGMQPDVNVAPGGVDFTDAIDSLLNQSTSFSNSERNTTFYSQLLKTIQEATQAKATPQQWEALFQKSGVKQEEIDWLDVKGFFSGKPTVSKSDLAEYVAAHQVEVKEGVKQDTGDWVVYDGEANQYFASRQQAEEYAREQGIDITSDSVFVSPDTKETHFAQYQLPGGSNYREVLLTLPKREAKSMVDVIKGNYANFQSSHFDEPNILSHVRFNERVDSENNKVLFIEELQSDWSAAGRKKGFTPADHVGEFTDAQREEANQYYDIRPEVWEKLSIEARDSYVLEMRETQGKRAVPRAPFVTKTQTWALLAMKQMIRYAAENGFERIAWTTGTQQIERYWGNQTISDAVDRFKKVTEPQSVRELSQNIFGAEMSALMPFDIVDGGMLGSLNNDKVKRIVVSDLPVDVVNILRDKQLSANQIFSDPEMVTARLSVDGRRRVADGILSSMRDTGATIRTKLSDLHLGGGEILLFPALRASDLNSSEVAGIIAPSAIFHLGPSISPQEAAAAGATAKSLSHEERRFFGEKFSPAKFAEFLNAHAEIIHGQAGLLKHGFEAPPHEGMKAFYDTMLPNIVNKYVKKWGAKVGPAKISGAKVEITKQSSGKYHVATDSEVLGVFDSLQEAESAAGKSTVPSFDITPSMRSSVLQGQPLFSQIKQTDSPAFKAWFKDSVVTVDGKPGSEPLTVYHGTYAEDITEFDPDLAGQSGFGSAAGGMEFTSSQYVASHYAGASEQYINLGYEAGNVMPVFLKIQKPFVVTADMHEGQFEVAHRYGNEIKHLIEGELTIDDLREYGTDSNLVNVNLLIDAWDKQGGIDGIIIEDASWDADDSDLNTQYIAFRPEQIKSATGNRGTFSPTDPDILFSLADRDPPYVRRLKGEQAQIEEELLPADAMSKLGLSETQGNSLKDKISNLTYADLKSNTNTYAKRAYEGIFDGLIGIFRAEEEVGGVAPEKSGYIGARMSTSVSDLMTAVLKYGAPEWRDGGIQHKEGTIGLMDIVQDLGADLPAWLGWMAGNRAKLLKGQGREQNLTDTDIQWLLDQSQGKEDKFQTAKQEYNKLNQSMLDFAEVAGEIDPGSRKKWESDWYVPFYRATEEDVLLAPHTKRGLSHQSAGIKALRGGKLPTNNLLENILTNWVKLTDSATKNMALLKTVDNLKDTRFLTDETMKYKQVIVPKSEIVKRIKADRVYTEMVADMLGIMQTDALLPSALEVKVLHELATLDRSGFEKLWSIVAPTDKDVIRVMRGGKYEYYRVHDAALLRAVSHLGFTGFNDPVTKSMRWFKRLLTTGVTTSPDFMFRNFVRDAAHAWAINKDGFTFGKDSITGLTAALREDEDFRALMFEMGSFQGGYVHGTDPEANAQIIQRTLQAKGLQGAGLDLHMRSILNTPKKLWDAVEFGWQKYRGLGDKIENSNRLATYKRALEAGKHPVQAAFEAKDQMDYNRRGNWQALMWFTDVVPFLNARLQGTEKLYRAAKQEGKLSRVFAIKFAKIATFSVILTMLNDDDDDYKELPDWEKDAYWHFWIADQHFRIPKPFEIGILAGTIPERMYHAWVTGSQPNEKLLWSLKHNLFQTLNFNPVPQIAVPAIEVWGNRSFYFDTPIEGMADQNKLPEARFNERTTEIAKGFGAWLGVSPKQLEHLWEGYTGTMGAYILAAADMAARRMLDAPGRASMEPSQVIGLKSFYRGSGPVYSTQYETDLYDALEEVNQIYSTITAYQRDGLIDQSKTMRLAGKEKLKYRARLRHASERINILRKQIAQTQRSRILSPDSKREKIDQLLTKKNEIAKRTAESVEEAF